MPKKKVLITGASGLIGGLTIAGLGGKYDFSGLSRRRVSGIPHLAADITHADAIKPAFQDVDTVLHLAAANGVDEVNDWNATMASTVQGTLNVYEAAREADVKRVIHMSSGCTQLAYEWDDKLPYGKSDSGELDYGRSGLARPSRLALRRGKTVWGEPGTILRG